MIGELNNPDFWLKYRVSTIPLRISERGQIPFTVQAEGAFQIDFNLYPVDPLITWTCTLEFTNGQKIILSDRGYNELTLPGKPYVKRDDVIIITELKNAELSIRRHVLNKNKEIRKNDSFSAK